MAISGGGVALTVVGGLLVYGGLANATPVTALHGLLTGQPPTLGSGPSTVIETASQQTSTTGTAAATVAAGQNSATSTAGGSIVAGAQQFKGDLYSQSKRNEVGYSDCSSFVAKAMIAAGINPCNWTPGSNYPTTVSFGLWSGLKGISLSQAQPGDILLHPGVHMAIVTGSGTAIGQENSSVNVREGSFDSIMAFTGTYGCYRVVA